MARTAKQATKKTAKKAAKTTAKATAKKPGKPIAKPAGVGFGPETFAFLAELERNNERPWFEANRERYERCVRAPALAWISAFGPLLAKFAPHFVADPRPAGGSLMRIHRDTRFAADKRPYKSHIGIHFRHAGGKDIHAPGLYVHVEPGASMLGVGLWRPEPEPLAKIREHLVDEPDAWRAVTSAPRFRKFWKLGGESLARVPRGYDKAHPLADDLRRKDHIAGCSVDDDLFAGPIAAFAERYSASAAYLGFLCDALDLAI